MRGALGASQLRILRVCALLLFSSLLYAPGATADMPAAVASSDCTTVFAAQEINDVVKSSGAGTVVNVCISPQIDPTRCAAHPPLRLPSQEFEFYFLGRWNASVGLLDSYGIRTRRCTTLHRRNAPLERRIYCNRALDLHHSNIKYKASPDELICTLKRRLWCSKLARSVISYVWP